MKQKSYAVRKSINQGFLSSQDKPLLGWLDTELTERCNNNCLHCYINLPENDAQVKKRELPFEEVKRILKEAASLGCMTVRFTGGEPLLREDFKEIYLFSKREGLRVMIFTNATLITAELAQIFKRYPPGDKIEVSVYGMKEASYEAVVRRRGAFGEFQEGLARLKENKIPFVVKSAFLPQNKQDIPEFESWAASIPWMDQPASQSMFFDLRCRRDSQQKNRLIRDYRLSPQEGLKLLTRNKEDYVRGMREFCSKFIAPAQDKLLSCGSGLNSGCVDAYGFFQPCLLLRHPDTVYDLRNGTLKDALLNFFPELRKMRATNAEYLARCAKCFLKGLCEQCPAKSWMEHGTLDTPVEYHCEIAHAQARFLGLLREDEFAWEVADWRQRIKEFTESTVKKAS